MKQLTIVIPNKAGQDPRLTIESLYRQTFTDFDIIIINDNENNACRARNRGFKMVDTPFVLFSDNDINWVPDALEVMYKCLVFDPSVSFSWGAYELNRKIWCNREWDPEALLVRNYISGMAMVRTKHHPGWDENIRRLQDWDVWLTMLSNGYTGKYAGKVLFSTPLRDGITRNSIPLDVARKVIIEKHNLKIEK